MTPERSVAWLGREKERRALDFCLQHIDKIIETVEAMDETVYSFSKGSNKFKKKSEKVLDKEREADRIQEKIINELSKGRYLPLSREKIIRLSITAEHIADNARAAAVKLTYLNPKNIDEDIRDGLSQLSHFSSESVKILKETYTLLLEDEDIEATINKTEEVEKMEEKIDYFRANELIPRIVNWADEFHRPGTTIHLIQIEENIEEVSDQVENTADAIREIALGSM